MEKKARPATTIIYQFAGWKCIISCHPQQRWRVTDNGDTVRLERKPVPQKKKRVYYHGYRGATSMDELLADFKKKMGVEDES